MSNRDYLMTEVEKKYLEDNDIPYVPSVYEHYEGNFKKYLAYFRLAAYRNFGWKDSNHIQMMLNKVFRRIKND